MSRYRDQVQAAVLLIGALAAVTAADAKSQRGKPAAPGVARNEIEPADGGYIIVTAPRRAAPPRATATVPVGATIRIDETAIARSSSPAGSAKR